jgi:hypothetical protein
MLIDTKVAYFVLGILLLDCKGISYFVVLHFGRTVLFFVLVPPSSNSFWGIENLVSKNLICWSEDQNGTFVSMGVFDWLGNF